jgi:hypothetical protein
MLNSTVFYVSFLGLTHDYNLMVLLFMFTLLRLLELKKEDEEQDEGSLLQELGEGPVVVVGVLTGVGLAVATTFLWHSFLQQISGGLGQE